MKLNSNFIGLIFYNTTRKVKSRLLKYIHFSVMAIVKHITLFLIFNFYIHIRNVGNTFFLFKKKMIFHVNFLYCN